MTTYYKTGAALARDAVKCLRCHRRHRARFPFAAWCLRCIETAPERLRWRLRRYDA